MGIMPEPVFLPAAGVPAAGVPAPNQDQVPRGGSAAVPAPALARYRAAVARTDALIERANAPEGKTPAEIRARAELRLGRVRLFLAQLGDPHRRYPVVHVAGTSGKGSTSTAIAAILTAAGYRVGLHTSPYLQAPTEKLQLDGRLIAADGFADLVDLVLGAHEAWCARGGERLTYGEIWMALLAAHFVRERVDVAVVEVGAGGRFDLTNVVDPAVSVVTSIGLDHTVTLGETIPEIAWHKAGIIKAGAPAVTAVTDPEALAPIRAEVEAVGTRLTRVVAGVTFAVTAADADGTRWRELDANRTPGPELPAPPGRFQAANAATAVAAVRALAGTGRGFAVPPAAIRDGLGQARIPGRFETVQRAAPDGSATRVVLDGAHNPDKVAALAADLGTLRRAGDGGRLVVVLGALEAKRHGEMVRLLVPHADGLVLTSPRVLAKPGAVADELAATVRAVGFTGPVVIEPDPLAVVDRALALVRDDVAATVLVTGSLYLVGNVRGRWFPDDAVVMERTPWPTVRDSTDPRSVARGERGEEGP